MLADGISVFGGDLIKGVSKSLPHLVTVTGSLSGPPKIEILVLLGLYVDRLRVACGVDGGWEPFGSERLKSVIWRWVRVLQNCPYLLVVWAKKCF